MGIAGAVAGGEVGFEDRVVGDFRAFNGGAQVGSIGRQRGGRVGVGVVGHLEVGVRSGNIAGKRGGGS